MQEGTTQRERSKRPRPAPLDWDLIDLRTPRVDGPAVLSLGRNRRGRDLVVGDIHGQRETFEHLLEKVGFSPDDGDRLLLVGDLIDRGPDSASMFEWLRREGVICVRGNHEQMMLDALEGDRMAREVWIEVNGGEWSEQLTTKECDAWRERLRKMPLAVEVEGGQGTFVLVHAEIPIETPWWALKAWLAEADHCAGVRAIWARDRINQRSQPDHGVPDVWRTFHGHTPLKQLVQIANMRWIDLAAAYAHRIESASIACIPIGPDGSERDPVVARVLDVDPKQFLGSNSRQTR